MTEERTTDGTPGTPEGAPEESPQGGAPGSAQGTTEQSPTEAVEEMVESGGTVEAGLDLGSAKGPALDQDEGQVQTDTERNRRKERVGLVVSDKPDKTVSVSVEALVRHPLYKKRVRRSKKFLVHDEGNEARVGDTVRIIETRPISARKRWRLANIVSRAE